MAKKRNGYTYQFSSVSVIQSCPTLCDPMNCSTPSLPVHHQLLEFTQTHVHRVGDAIQPSHLLSSPSPPAFNLSQLRVFSNESVLIRWPRKGMDTHISSVQSLNHIQLLATPWTAAHQASLSITNSRSLLKLMSIESVMSSNHLILCLPFSCCPQSFPAQGLFQ